MLKDFFKVDHAFRQLMYIVAQFCPAELLLKLNRRHVILFIRRLACESASRGIRVHHLHLLSVLHIAGQEDQPP